MLGGMRKRSGRENGRGREMEGLGKRRRNERRGRRERREAGVALGIARGPMLLRSFVFAVVEGLTRTAQFASPGVSSSLSFCFLWDCRWGRGRRGRRMVGGEMLEESTCRYNNYDQLSSSFLTLLSSSSLLIYISLPLSPSPPLPLPLSPPSPLSSFLIPCGDLERRRRRRFVLCPLCVVFSLL